MANSFENRRRNRADRYSEEIDAALVSLYWTAVWLLAFGLVFYAATLLFPQASIAIWTDTMMEKFFRVIFRALSQ